MERKIRKDKGVRVNPNLTPHYHTKLKMLALACDNMTKTELAKRLIAYCLDNPEIVRKFQEIYPPADSYLRVTPLLINDHMTYKTGYDPERLLK
ncbi:MAG TPA: hypothetical protein VK190_11335 [Pseudoneobacillus sp.]|nr:hypothetical protein [Pseudoneobacillus sp.]